jgi:2-C-methyl-D-erythritol 4-phosphate cytidylyltransferase
VTWGHCVHDRVVRCLIIEAAVRAFVGQQHITRVVEDHDSREIFVLRSTVADAHRLSKYSVDVSRDYVIFKMIHRLNLIGSPYNLNYLNKTKLIRRH